MTQPDTSADSVDLSLDPAGEFPFAASEYFFYLVFQAARQRDQFFDEKVSELGLNIARWRTLAIIRRIQKCSMKDLALFSTVDRTTLSRSVDQLVEQGLVVRTTPARDRRKVSLELTEAGEDLYSKAIALMRDANHEMVAGVDREALRQATRLLRTVIRNIVPEQGDAADLVAFDRLRKQPAEQD